MWDMGICGIWEYEGYGNMWDMGICEYGGYGKNVGYGNMCDMEIWEYVGYGNMWEYVGYDNMWDMGMCGIIQFIRKMLDIFLFFKYLYFQYTIQAI